MLVIVELVRYLKSPNISEFLCFYYSFDTLKSEGRDGLQVVVSMDAPEKEKKEDLKGMYDLAIPLGMPVSVIRELVEKFELDLVRRKARMDMTGEEMDREILVLRGDLETVMAAKEYMFQALDRKTDEWKKDERGEKYRKLYEARVKERMEEEKANPTQPCDWTEVT